MDKNSKIFVAGSDTLIGSGILRVLENQGYETVLSAEGHALRDESGVESFFKRQNPEYVFLAAGKSGGIAANMNFSAELMLDNLLIECHVIEGARRYGVQKLLYFASSCCYPRNCPQPMREDYLLASPLEPTNEPYAVAKIAGIKLVQSYRTQYRKNFICVIPANCFGPGDDFSLENSHVIGALIHRMHEAKMHELKEVSIWGTGRPRRDFIYADDLADASLLAMQNYDEYEPINLGPGGDLSIAQLAGLVQEATGFKGNLVFDASKPDGMPVKLLDTTKIKALGWRSKNTFPQALELTYAWFLKNRKKED
jgi:GDP-L-fucose synthase